MDTYCVVIDGGATYYGGVRDWSVSSTGVVRLEFDQTAAQVFETDAVEVEVELAHADLVRSCLQRLVD